MTASVDEGAAAGAGDEAASSPLVVGEGAGDSLGAEGPTFGEAAAAGAAGVAGAAGSTGQAEAAADAEGVEGVEGEVAPSCLCRSRRRAAAAAGLGGAREGEEDTLKGPHAGGGAGGAAAELEVAGALTTFSAKALS